MRRRPSRLLPLAMSAILALGPAMEAFACTTIIVGKNASVNGSIIVARNSDSSKAVNAKHLMVHGSHFNVAGAMFHSNSNDFSYPLPDRSPKYLGLPYWYAHDESFEQVGANEYGVAVSATETITNSDAVLAVDPYVKTTGINEDAITSVLMQHARTAREGVRLLGEIITRHGAAEGFGVAVADADEVWWLETASGRHWAAARVPDDAFFVASNQARLQEIAVDDPENYLASPGLLDFAIANGLYDPDRDGDFDFRAAFARIIPADVQYNYLRIYTVLQMFTPSFEADFTRGEFPTFMSPAEPLGVADVADALRNHYQGTDKDPYTTANPDSPWRPIAVFRQSNSHVTELKGGNAPGAEIVTHFSMGMNLLGAYVPFYSGISHVPESYGRGDKTASSDSAFWTFRKVQTLAMRDFATYAPIVRDQYAALERSIAQAQERFEAEYNTAYAADPIKALEMMQAFSDDTAEEALQVAERLAETLFTMETTRINQTYLFEGQ